ncbi:hypothetical protein OROGR_032297 [Orobanche gracilis]
MRDGEPRHNGDSSVKALNMDGNGESDPLVLEDLNDVTQKKPGGVHLGFLVFLHLYRVGVYVFVLKRRYLLDFFIWPDQGKSRLDPEMFHTQGPLKNTCHLLAILSSRTEENKPNQNVLDEKKRFPFPKIVSSRRLEVHVIAEQCNLKLCGLDCTDDFGEILDGWSDVNLWPIRDAP